MTEDELADLQKWFESGDTIPITVDVPISVVEWIEEHDLNIRRLGDGTPRNAAIIEQVRAELRMMIIHSFMDNFRPARDPDSETDTAEGNKSAHPDDGIPF